MRPYISGLWTLEIIKTYLNTSGELDNTNMDLVLTALVTRVRTVPFCRGHSLQARAAQLGSASRSDRQASRRLLHPIHSLVPVRADSQALKAREETQRGLVCRGMAGSAAPPVIAPGRLGSRQGQVLNSPPRRRAVIRRGGGG